MGDTLAVPMPVGSVSQPGYLGAGEERVQVPQGVPMALSSLAFGAGVH